MKLDHLFDQVTEFNNVITNAKPGSRQLVTGLNGSSKTVFINGIYKNLTRPMVIVTDTLAHADQLTADLANLIAEDQLFEFPVEEIGASELATSSPEYKSLRVLALNKLASGEPAVIVTSTSGIRRILPTREQFASAHLKISLGDEFNLADLKIQLHQMGYSMQKMVAAPGEFSIRGSIVDIYPLSDDNPVRIDFFDTEVDSMRSFNVADQRSIENVESSEILPASDLLMTSEQRQNLVEKLQQSLATVSDDLDDEATKTLSDSLGIKITDLQNGLNDPYWLLFSKMMYAERTSILDYLGENGIVLYDEYSKLTETNKQLLSDEEDWLSDKAANHEILPGFEYTNDFKAVFKAEKHASVLFSLFKKGLTNLKFTQLSQLNTRPMQQFFSSMPMLKGEVDRWTKGNTTVVMMVQDQNRLEKVANTLADFGITVTVTSPTKIIEGQAQLIANGLDNGFELPQNKLAVITERELFQKVTKKRRKMTTFNNAERIKSYTDLKPGDFVVHVNHGIGRYEGMKTMEVDGKHQDYLTITYKDNAQLFIPVSQLNLIQKYVSSEDKHPRINKLGGSEWAKTKQKVASKIEDIADDLIELYAKRSAQKGYAYPKDDSLQHDFEDEFPYNETPDQLRSAQEIKRDMEASRPMDRLLVGDVGYGKTEVALRAAFKAIEVGKQVAFLVPTTILAQQHFETMTDRFSEYPITIKVLSRFQTKAEMKETIAGLKDGSVDVVVGTHRILSKDVGFKDLGLLIIDEEQRFGVKHKERIKELRSNVDVLTLTATPIPRTLNMSMMGIRDLSVIETPPANRYPIQTYVMEQNAGAIRDAIDREMARGGQVFYLHNRVDDIEKTVADLEELTPDARIGYIHGKMTENQLENVLYEFINGEYDVLVTTTIIETGVDIPNVNTLFVENADRMGLSQLYQLRGRIGRSSRVAYAYFMYQPNKSLTEVGEKRLEAIRDFTELGSGFKIAMRDLSIRGAGNLLGKQQHGFVDSVGYDLYTQMLSDAVAKKRGKEVTQTTDSVIEMDIEAYLPTEYIDDGQQKIELYKRIRQAENKAQIDEITDDLIDRFGDYPEPVANLLKVSEIKLNADFDLIEKVQRKSHNLTLTFSKLADTEFESKDLLKAIAETKFRATINSAEKKYQIKLVIQNNMTDWLDQLIKLLVELAKIRQEKSADGEKQNE